MYKLFVVAVLSGLSISSQSENLAEVYELAMKYSPAMRIAEANYKAGHMQMNIHLAGLLPQLSAHASYENKDTNTKGVFPITLDQDQNPITPEIRALRPVDNQSDEKIESWGASISQVIFDAKAWFDFKQGAYQSDKAKYDFAAQQQQLIYDISEAYFNVLRHYDNLALSRAQQQSDQKQLIQVSKRAEVGLNAEADVIQTQASLDLSFSRQLDDEDAFGTAVDTLTAMIGYKQLQQLAPLKTDSTIALLEPQDSKVWEKLAMTANMQLKSAEADMKANRSKSRSALSAHFPSITAELRYNESKNRTEETDNNLPFEFDSETEGKSIMINARIPLYAGGRIDANRRQAHYQFLSAQETLNASILEVRRNTRSAYRKVNNGAKRLKARKQALASNQKALHMVERGYKAGVNAISDVLSAQKNLYTAEREANNSRYDHILNILKLKQHAGQLSPADIYLLSRQLSDTASIEI